MKVGVVVRKCRVDCLGFFRSNVDFHQIILYLVVTRPLPIPRPLSA